MALSIRLYRPSDLSALYHICLLTGDSGKDASAKCNDHDLIGHYYAAPYAVIDPTLCFVVANDDDEAVGYVLGTADTLAFVDQCEVKWFPPLRARYALPSPNDASLDARLIRLIHRGMAAQVYISPELLAQYPAHLHIDLLPVAQGQGFGKQLMTYFLNVLRSRGVKGVHLGVGATNINGIAFYRRCGFKEIAKPVWGLVFGMGL